MTNIYLYRGQQNQNFNSRQNSERFPRPPQDERTEYIWIG